MTEQGSRARELEDQIDALEDADNFMPPPEDRQAIAVMIRHWRRFWADCERTFGPGQDPEPEWASEFTAEQQIIFQIGCAYERLRASQAEKDEVPV